MATGSIDVRGFTEVPFVELPFTDFAGDVEPRWQRMNGLLDRILNNYHEPKILDVATGGGQDTVSLIQRGYDVTANEVDELFAARLHAKSEAAKVAPKVLNLDWRDFMASPELGDEEFDVLFALGNSFPNYLFKAEERKIALQGFWRLLKSGGTLFFDTRNYDYMLENADAILEDPERNFDYSYNNTYYEPRYHWIPD